MDAFNKYIRYQRQVKLKELGTTGQDKLFQAKILVIGAGGLGCPALQYLAAAGVGTIGIVDFDIIELSNLQRQTLYNIEDIGNPKAVIAAKKLRAFNPGINFFVHNMQLTTKNALDLIDKYDVIMDGTDNFATRYLVNDACVLLNKPLVYGAVLRFEGQVGVFNLKSKNNDITNYRDLFPNPPTPSTVPSCSEAGVLGVLPGIIGTLQASEVIKIITGIGKSLRNKVLSYNILNNEFYEFDIPPVLIKKTHYPKNKSEFEDFDYEWLCGIKHNHFEITVADFEILRKSDEVMIMDVREMGELPVMDEFRYTHLPLSALKEKITDHWQNTKTVIFCQTGKRSLAAAQIVKEKFPDSEVYSLKGGIEEWGKFKMNTSGGKIKLSEHETGNN